MNGDQDNDPPSPPDSTMADNVSIASNELPNFFVQRHGRDFHATIAPYFLPADQEEMQRLNDLHRLLNAVVGGNHFGLVANRLAPAPGRRKRVVDLGSGSGIWVEEMATEFPHVKFIGIDLVPTATQFPPRNAQFECYNFLAGLGIRLRDASIDVVHARSITFGINQYLRLAEESFRVLQPGGDFLSAEIDIRPDSVTVVSDPNGPMPATRQLLHRMQAIIESLAPPSIPGVLEQVGFQEVTSIVVWVPLGPDMGEIGAMAVTSMVQLLVALRPALLDQDGATQETINVLLEQARVEIESGIAGVQIPYHLVHARRPV